MTEQKEIILLIYQSESTECTLGHFRFLASINEAQEIVKEVKATDGGSIMIVRGAIVEEVTSSRV